MKHLLRAIYSIRPLVEGYWEKARLGGFVNSLPQAFSETEQAIYEIVRASPLLRKECRRAMLLSDPHQLMSPGEFVSRLFGFSPDWLDEEKSDSHIQQLREVLADAEKAFLRHVQVAVSPKATFTSGGAFRLRCSHVFSPEKTTKGGTPLSKAKAKFKAADYLKELKAAGVPARFYKQRPSSNHQILAMYEGLPEVVKDMFFTVSMDGDLHRDLPLYLARDLILFADDLRWDELRQACESEDKKKFTEISRKFLAEFLTFERQQNGFRLGLVRGTEDNVMSRDFTSREQAFLDFCKPGKWVGKTKQYNQTDEEY